MCLLGPENPESAVGIKVQANSGAEIDGIKRGKVNGERKINDAPGKAARQIRNTWCLVDVRAGKLGHARVTS